MVSKFVLNSSNDAIRILNIKKKIKQDKKLSKFSDLNSHVFVDNVQKYLKTQTNDVVT